MKTFTLEVGVMRDGVVHWEPLRTYETKAECANAVIWRAHFIPGDPEEDIGSSRDAAAASTRKYFLKPNDDRGCRVEASHASQATVEAPLMRGEIHE